MRIPLAIVMLWILMAAGPAHGADPSLDVVPTEVVTRTLTKDMPIEVEVRLKAGDDTLTAIAISTFSNDGINADFATETPFQLQKLAPKSEHSWRLKLTRDAGSVLSESILHVRAAFDISPAAPTAPPGPAPTGIAPAGTPPTGPAPDGAEPTHRLLYTTAKIKPQAVTAGVDLAKAEIKGAPETLAHERQGRIFIIITNQYSRPMTVVNVNPLGPTFIELVNPTARDASDKSARLPHPKLPMQILPGQTGTLDYKIEAKSEVVPGKYSLIAAVDVTTEDKLAATVMTAPQEIGVVVLGESDILKFLGIPSLLFLPGVLMLISWRFLWSLGKSSAEVATYPIQLNSSDFWVIAVALSLFMALIYPWLTGLLLPSSRNFLVAYGFLDFSLIFGISLVATGLFFGGWRGVTKVRQRRQARDLAESSPSAEDTPREILTKLAKLKKDSLCEQVYFTSRGEQSERLLVLEPWQTADELWLIPPAGLRNVDLANYDGIDESDRLVNDAPADAATVLAKIRQGMEQRWWGEPGWRTVGDVRHPIKVKRDGWAKSNHLGRLIQGD